MRTVCFVGNHLIPFGSPLGFNLALASASGRRMPAAAQRPVGKVDSDDITQVCLVLGKVLEQLRAHTERAEHRALFSKAFRSIERFELRIMLGHFDAFLFEENHLKAMD